MISPNDRKTLQEFKRSANMSLLLSFGYKHESDCKCGGMLQSWFTKNGQRLKWYHLKNVFSLPTGNKVKVHEHNQLEAALSQEA